MNGDKVEMEFSSCAFRDCYLIAITSKNVAVHIGQQRLTYDSWDVPSARFMVAGIVNGVYVSDLSRISRVAEAAARTLDQLKFVYYDTVGIPSGYGNEYMNTIIEAYGDIYSELVSEGVVDG